jgi:hypothetical protein
VHWASIGWIPPELRDPDGHEVRYTIAHHTELDPSAVTTLRDPREPRSAGRARLAFRAVLAPGQLPGSCPLADGELVRSAPG